jgi:hypothetical protein
LTQIYKSRGEKENITADNNEIHGIIREYFENLYHNKLENLDKMDTFYTDATCRNQIKE